MGQIILVTGPARSGKSEWAESLATQSGKSVIYVATAQLDPTDAEWQIRIAQHQQRRPATWQTLNVSVDLAATLNAATALDCLLVDSLGTWLANVIDQDTPTWEQTLQSLWASIQTTAGQVVFVAEETGWGVVPAYALGRTFRDRLGCLTRQIGQIAHPVYLVTGGHVLNLSSLGSPLGLPSVSFEQFVDFNEKQENNASVAD